MSEALKELGLKLTAADIELFFHPNKEERNRLLAILGLYHVDHDVFSKGPGAKMVDAKVLFTCLDFPGKILSLRCQLNWLGDFRLHSWEPSSLEFVEYNDLDANTKLGYHAAKERSRNVLLDNDLGSLSDRVAKLEALIEKLTFNMEELQEQVFYLKHGES